MNNSPVFMIIIALLVIFVVVFLINKKKGKKTEPNYRVFFILGITWLPIGIATDNSSLWVMGVAFLIVGLANRDKWKEEPKWSELSPMRRKIMLSLVIGLTVLLLAGIVFYFLAKSN